MIEWEGKENQDAKEDVEVQESLESSIFEYHAVPLDKLETLDSEGNQYSIKELMQLKDLREELGE